MTDIPAGWYRDPSTDNVDGLSQRYWDGFSWSQQVRHAETAPAYQAAQPGREYHESVIPSTPDGQTLSGWWMRVLASIADGVILAPLLVLVSIPSLMAHWGSITAWWNANLQQRPGALPMVAAVPSPPVLDPTTTAGALLFGSLFVTNVLYALVFLRWKQATPGKLLVGLRIRRREVPGPMPWSTILRRVGFVMAFSAGAQVPAIGIVFLAVGLVDYLWPLWDPKKQALHDKVAGTNVVRAT